MWHQPPRKGNRGRYPKPLLMPLPGLLYAQVVKARDHGRIVQVDSKIVFGNPKALAEKLTSLPTSATINTSFVERHNLTQRQSNRRLTRRTNGFSKDLSWFERQLWLSLAYYHLALPHRRLRQPLPEPEPTRGLGSLRRWQPVTPAMAAKLTDHVWTTTELLSYRVPSHFLDELPDLESICTHRLRKLITAVEGHYRRFHFFGFTVFMHRRSGRNLKTLIILYFSQDWLDNGAGDMRSFFSSVLTRYKLGYKLSRHPSQRAGMQRFLPALLAFHCQAHPRQNAYNRGTARDLLPTQHRPKMKGFDPREGYRGQWSQPLPTPAVPHRFKLVGKI